MQSRGPRVLLCTLQSITTTMAWIDHGSMAMMTLIEGGVQQQSLEG
jgi:hypothetical protein